MDNLESIKTRFIDGLVNSGAIAHGSIDVALSAALDGFIRAYDPIAEQARQQYSAEAANLQAELAQVKEALATAEGRLAQIASEAR